MNCKVTQLDQYRTRKEILTVNTFINYRSTIYNMSGCDANVVNGLKNDSSYEFIGEVILKINVV